MKDAGKKPVNGDEKVRILLAEGLIKVAEPAAAPEPEAPEEGAEAEVSEEAAENAEDGDTAEAPKEDADSDA